MTAMTTSSIEVSRPTIAVAGQDEKSLSDGLLNMVISENVNGLYRCEAVFGNWGTVNQSVDYLYFDRSLLEFGRQFKIKFDGQVLFDGKITGLEAHYRKEGPREITVLAEDRFQDLRMTRRTRTFENVSDADLVNQIAGDHGLTADVDMTGPTHTVLAQVNQSDLAFLRDRARAVGGELWMEGATLHAKARSGRGRGAALEMTYQQSLQEFSVLADLAGQCTALVVSGWDVAAKSAISHEAGQSVISSELQGGVSGASILSSAFGDRKETITHAVPLTTEEAQAQAEAFFRLTARRFVVGRGVCKADPAIRVGASVDLKQLGPLFDGKYYLSEVKHLFDGLRGIRTQFTAERPWLGQV